MTTSVEAVTAISNRLVETPGLSAARRTLENVTYTPPQNESWTRLAIRHVGGGQETLGEVGNRRHEDEGILLFQVFGRPGYGVKDAYTLADTLRDRFESESFGGVDTFGGRLRDVGDDGTGWHLLVLEIPFRYDRTK